MLTRAAAAVSARMRLALVALTPFARDRARAFDQRVHELLAT
jgi:hypothetical protein